MTLPMSLMMMFSHAHLPGQLCVDLQHALFSVDRDEELGLDQGVDDLQLLLAGVARHVEGPGVLADHLGLFPVKLVDDVIHGILVARDGRGRDDDPVAAPEYPPGGGC